MNSEIVEDIIYLEDENSLSQNCKRTGLHSQSIQFSSNQSIGQCVSPEKRCAKVLENSPPVITIVDISGAGSAAVSPTTNEESAVLSSTFDSYLSMFTESLEGFDLNSSVDETCGRTADPSSALPRQDFPFVINTVEDTSALSSIPPSVNTASLGEYSRLLTTSFYCCYSCLAVNNVLNADEDSGQLLCFACGQLLAWEKCQNCSTVLQLVPGCHHDVIHPKRVCSMIVVRDLLDNLVEAAVVQSEIRKEGLQLVDLLVNELIESSLELSQSKPLVNVSSILHDLISNLPDKETELIRKFRLVPVSVAIKRMKREDVEFFSESSDTVGESNQRLRKRVAKATSCVCCPDQAHNPHLCSDEDPDHTDNDYDPVPDIRAKNRTSFAGTGKRFKSTRKLFYCNLCGDAFLGQSLLERHKEKKHGFSCHYCGVFTGSLEDFRDECFN
jgi:hypothetical protein